MGRWEIVALVVLIAAMGSSGCTKKADTPIESDLTSKPVEIKGSDTMVQMVSNLAESYSETYPGRKISVTGGGSGTGIKALINGEVDIADASRPIKDEEVASAKESGFEIWEFAIARDMLGVVANPNNPVDRLSFEEVSMIYKGEIKNWKEVGGNDMEITLYGRQRTSGTYEFFRELVVKADYSLSLRNMEGNSQIRDAVSSDVKGVGYLGIGYINDAVKAIEIAEESGGEYYSPLDSSVVQAGSYPISRALYQYTAKRPEKGDAVYKFLEYELSGEGQGIVKESGVYPLLKVDMEANAEKFAVID